MLCYIVKTVDINEFLVNITKQPLGAVWVRRFLDLYFELIMNLFTHIDRQGKEAENSELFHYYFSKLFNYISENDIKAKNRFNMNEKGFFIRHIKC